MISLDEIDKTILELEQHDTTYATIEKLAWLYIVRDKLAGPVVAKTGTYTGGEFCEICSNVPLDLLMPIISEHFEAIKVLYPREYDVIVNKIKKISP